MIAQTLLVRALGRYLVTDDLHIALNAGQHIVEVMGDAAGQGAHGFHLLGLDQLALRFLRWVISLTVTTRQGLPARFPDRERNSTGNLRPVAERAVIS
jgi:hypothetical protein